MEEDNAEMEKEEEEDISNELIRQYQEEKEEMS